MFRNLWLTVFLVALLGVTGFFIALPWLAKTLLTQVLQEQLQGSAAVGEVELDLAHGIVRVVALEAADSASLKLRSGELRADIGLRALLSGSLTGEIELRDALVDYGDLTLKLGQLHFKGVLLEGPSAEASSWVVRGDLSVQGLGLFDRERQLTLLSLGSASLRQAQLNTTTLATSIPELSLGQIGAVNTGSDDSRWLYGEAIDISGLAYADNLLQVERIISRGVRSSLQITEQGELESQGVLSASLDALAGAEDGESEPTPTEAEFEFSVGELLAENSEIFFVDRQLASPMELTLQVEELRLGTLSSLAPEQASELLLKSRVGEYGRIDMDGQFSPMAEQLGLNLKGDIAALRLPLVSPYIEGLLGYELSAGQFDHSFDIAIANEMLTASNQIDLRGLKVNKLEDVEPEAPLPMPLDRALDLLRDKEGNIYLDVPLQGHLDDPDIGLDQIISRALGKSLTTGSTTLLKLALQPYGAIWMGAEMGLKLAGRVRLDPMLFPARLAVLQEQQLDYANKIGDLLSERPALNLTLCGLSGLADREGLEQNVEFDFKALAQARASALKSHLVNNKQIDPERLYLCKPEVDPQGKVSGIRLDL